MTRSVHRPGRLPAGYLLIAWAAFVVYGSLVPFDFKFPGWEVAAGHILGLGQRQTRFQSVTDWVTNVAIYMPIGFLGLAALAQRQAIRPVTGAAILTLVGGLALSIGIELAQVLFPPRVSSALDVVANGLGIAIGTVAWIVLGDGVSTACMAVTKLHTEPARLVRPPRTIVAVVLGGYALLVGAWAGFFTGGWTDWTGGLTRAGNLQLLPFVQHQDAAIGLAVASTLVVAVVFAPLGAILWFLGGPCARTLQGKLGVAALAAGGLAVILETAKLFVLARRPDTGNVVIACVTAAAGYLLAPLAAGQPSRTGQSERTLDTPAAPKRELMASMSTPRQTAPAHQMRMPRPPGDPESGPTLVLALVRRRTILHGIVAILTLAVMIAIVTRLPFMPYNVRELLNPFHPVAVPLLFATFVVWTLGLPVVIARWLTTAKIHIVSYVPVVAIHGFVAWAMLHFAVLPESIHDVVGSPVLNWPWEIEMIARFVPLFSVLSVQLTGGALIVAGLTGKRTGAAILWWLLSAGLLFPIQYWAVISEAATDNITELIADNASVASCLLLSAYLLLAGVVGSLLAALGTVANGRRVAFALGTLAASLPIGYLCLSTGTEAVILKNGKIYSALQFLLSTDRSNYAAGLGLEIRFAVAHLGLVLGTAFAQLPFRQDTGSAKPAT